MMLGYLRGLAILFVEYLAIFGASTAKTTLLMGVMAGVYSVAGKTTVTAMGAFKDAIACKLATVSIVVYVWETSLAKRLTQSCAD
jgi:hypothetical protein